MRAAVTSKLSLHLLLPLTSFGPQRHKIPAEIQPRIRSDECAKFTAPPATARSRIKYTCGSPQHRNASHPRLTASTLNPIIARMSKSKTPCDEARDCWKNRKGRWVRVHGIARRTLFGPTHDEQPFCQYLTARRKTTVRFLGQQREMTIDMATNG